MLTGKESLKKGTKMKYESSGGTEFEYFDGNLDEALTISSGKDKVTISGYDLKEFIGSLFKRWNIAEIEHKDFVGYFHEMSRKGI